LTPEELKNIVDSKRLKRSFRGYRSSDVDGLIAEFLNYYTRLYTEKSELEKRVAFYVEQEAILRNAILHSEQAAASIRADAEAEANNIVLNAQKQAMQKAEEMQEQIKRLEEEVRAYKENVHKRFYTYEREARFLLDRFYKLVRNHVELLDKEITSEVQRMINNLDSEISSLPKPSPDILSQATLSSEEIGELPSSYSHRRWEDAEHALLVGCSLISDVRNSKGDVVVSKGTIVTPKLIEDLVSKGLYGELIEAIETDCTK